MTHPALRSLRLAALICAAAALPLLGAGGAGAVVPATPAGCSADTATFAQTTPADIPAGPSVVTSTLEVSGVTGRLYDLDVTTNVAHTFSADIDMTLTSPAGTVVTLTTDNAGSSDHAFNGTVWDDSADPDGSVPYTSNTGLASDTAYVNGVAASPLVPEESFGAFIGEDPNGTWTLTISDDQAGDGGSLSGWSMTLTTVGTGSTTPGGEFQTTPSAVTIPAGPAVVASTIDVSGGSPISDIDVLTNITHTAANHLDVTLTSPAGTVVTLTTDNGVANGNVFNGTLWDDDANPAGTVPYVTNDGIATDHAYVNLTTATPLEPEESLAAFIGQDPNGTWTLTVSDDTALDGGSLDSWSMQFQTAACTADMSAAISDAPDPVVVGEALAYEVMVTNGGISDAADASVRLPLPASAQFTSATASAGGSCTTPAAGATGSVDCVWASPTPPGMSRTVQVIVTPTVAGALSATATASSATPDADATNDAATAATTVTAPDLAVAINDAPDPVVAGGSLTYDVSVTNSGDAAAADVSVSVPLPASVQFTSATASAGASCTTPATSSTWTVTCGWSGNTAPASTRTLVILLTAPTATTLNTTVTAATTTLEPDLTDNSAAAATTVSPAPTAPPTSSGPVAEDGKLCTVIGTHGPETLVGTSAPEVICGLGGADRILNGGSGDTVDAGAGDDIVAATGSGVLVFGGPGNDRLTGTVGNDNLAGGPGDDKLTGGTGNDILNGNDGNDWLHGGSGVDRITAGAGRDRVTGGRGDDVLLGGTGDDVLEAGAGADYVAGDDGDDRLMGGAGRDRLAGGAGRDSLTGGPKLDMIDGGPGIDTSFGRGDMLTSVEIQR